MKKYIVTIAKPMKKTEKVLVEADSVSQILELSSTQIQISPVKRKDIILLTDLPKKQQNFHYRFVNIHENNFMYNS